MMQRVQTLTDRQKVIALALFALLLRAIGAWGTLFWYDEQFSWLLAQLPLDQLLAATQGDVHPPLYYLILWAWGGLVGYSEFALRVPSLLAGGVMIVVVYEICQQLEFDRRTTGLAVMITFLSPFQVYYSQEVRMYALVMLAFAVSVWAMLDRRWAMLVGASLVLLYLHNISPIFVAVLFASAWCWYSRDRRALVISAVAVGVGFLPGMYNLWVQVNALDGGYWIPTLHWLGLPRFSRSFAEFLTHFSATTFQLMSGLITGTILTLFIADLFYRLLPSSRAKLLRAEILVIALTFVPSILLALISLIWQPMLMYRVVSASAPFYYILVAATLTRTANRRTKLVPMVLASLVIITVGGFVFGRPDTERDHYAFTQAGDGVYHMVSGSIISYRYDPQAEQDVGHWFAPNSFGQPGALSESTINAFGYAQAPLKDVVCDRERWVIIWIDADFMTDALKDHHQQLVDTFPLREIERTGRSDGVFDRVIYELDTSSLLICNIQY